MKRFLASVALWLALLAPTLAQQPTYTQPVQMRDANLVTTNTQNLITTLSVFTAPRTLTLPGRGALNAWYIQFIDTANAISSVNTLTISMADGGLINGSPTLVLTNPGAYFFIIPNSTGLAASVIYPPGTAQPAGGTNGQIQYNNGGVLGGFTMSGDATTNTGTGALTLATVNANVGTFGSATQCITTTQNAKGLTTAISAATCTPVLGSITGFGTGVAAALAINVGSAGAPVLFNGAGGTPSSMTATNLSGTAAGLTAGNVTTNANLTGAVTSVGNATSLGSFSSANLRGALTDETGTGLAYFQGGDVGTPSAGVGTNLTALNATQLTSGTLPPARTNGHMNGEPSNGNAAAGEVGEYVESVIVTGSKVALVSGVAKTITSITLSAGDWDVSIMGYIFPAATTTTTVALISLSSATNTLDLAPGKFGSLVTASGTFSSANEIGLVIPPYRQSLSGSTTLFFVAQSNFAVSTSAAYGIIRARRMR